MGQKKLARACVAALLFATCFVVTQPGVTSAWTPTSPQVSVSVFRGASSDGSQSVTVDSSGYIYTTGYFAGTVDFDPGAGTANLTSTGGTDVYVSKLDASGNYVWAKRFGGTISDDSYSVAVDSSGNVYTTGFFYGTADFDPGAGTANLTSAGDSDAFVSKLDASGNYLWAKQFDGTSASYGWSMVLDSSDNVYTTGMFYGTADFDPGAGTANLTSAGNGDVYVSKLDASGNYVWAKQFGGAVNDRGFDVAVDSSGNVYTTGEFIGTADFDPGDGTANLSAGGAEDVFVSKLDASGNYVWAKQFHGGSSDIGYSLEVDASGNVYTTGVFRGSADFDPGDGIAEVISAGADDVFVSKLDASGNYVWAKQFGGSCSDFGCSVALDSSDNIYITGSFRLTADFDPTVGSSASLTSAGSTDVFILKIDASDASSSVTPSTTPGAPTFVSATSAEDTQSVVSWAAPVSTGGATITGYTVTSSPGGRTCVWTTGALSCTVTGLTNGTSYTFRVAATNVNGTGSSSVASNSITPSTTPGAPTSVTATSAADTQSVVSWTAPVSTGGATITGYTVTASPGGRTCVWTSGALFCTVTGLTNGTSYTFSVAATNARGTGSESEVSSSITPSTTPGAPTSVLATVDNAQSVVSWAAPVSTGGAPITGYTVASIPGARTCAWTTGALSCTVTGLTNGTSYTFVVTATNASGISGASVTSSVTPSTAPGAPTSVTATSAADTQSVVSWTAPVSTGGATITGYTVTSSPGGRTCAWATGALSCTVTGLTNGTSYTFVVTATNARGTGSESELSNSITPSTTPDAPTSVSATIGNAQSVVSWTAPVSTGGAAITGYTVTSSPGGRTCAWATGALSCTVKSLTNGTSYTFSVTATNASGTGIASDTSSSVTPTASQSITFTTITTQLLGDKTVALTATATSSRTVTFTSATSTVCTVSGSTVTMLTIGDCTINANQAGGSGWDTAAEVSRTFTILLSPPPGEPGVSVRSGDSYSNTKKVVLNMVWPEYATSVRISNDGGFAASKTQTKDLAASIDWELDDSVKGVFTKVVYVRFNGSGIDTTKTYSDDIILDTNAPVLESSTAILGPGKVDLSLKATDDITGVDKVEIKNGATTVTKEYKTKISVSEKELGLSVSSSGVRKLGVSSIQIRVSDNAGNWSSYETLSFSGSATTTTASTSTSTSPKVTMSKVASAKSIAAFAKLKVLSTSKVKLKIVASSAKFCRVFGTTLKGLKAGSCKVTVTVTPKKGRATSKTVTLKVTK